MEDKQGNVRAVETSLSVVELLVERDGARVTEVSDHLGVAPSTAYNHLQTLRDRGYVVVDDGVYQPSMQFLKVGGHARRRTPAYAKVKSRVELLAEESGGRTHFVVEEHGRGRYVFIKTGDLAVETFSAIGSQFPLHATAGGKAILSAFPDDRIDAVVERGLERTSDRTITDVAALREELRRVRENGVAFNLEEHNPGINAVAAPVHDPDGDVLGALAVSGPAKRFTDDYLRDEIADALLATVNELELDILYSD